MKRLVTIVFCMALTNGAYAEDCRSLDVVEWLLGDWATSPEQVVIREHWHRASEVTFEGESTARSVSDGQVVHYETLRLVAMSDNVFYVAKVTHNVLPVPFLLTRCSDGMAVFENPTHDAPQRLTYKLLDSSAADAPDLEVTVEGEGMNDFTLLFHRL